MSYGNRTLPSLEVPDCLPKENGRWSGSTSDQTKFGSDPSQPISKLPPLKWRPINVESSVMTCMAADKGVFNNCTTARNCMHVHLP